VIENFTNDSYIFLNNGALSGPGSATVSSIQADPNPLYAGGTLIFLSDGTQINLVGVNPDSITQGSQGPTHYITNTTT
jgi:hypothetical protein